MLDLLVVICGICFITIPVAMCHLSAVYNVCIFFGLGLLCLLIAIYWVFSGDEDDFI